VIAELKGLSNPVNAVACGLVFAKICDETFGRRLSPAGAHGACRAHAEHERLIHEALKEQEGTELDSRSMPSPAVCRAHL